MMAVTVEKCRCGHRACSDYWLRGAGRFVQGSGFAKAEAENIARLLNEEEAKAKRDPSRILKDAIFALIGSVQNPVENPVREDIEYGGILVDTPDGPKRAYLRLTFERGAQ